VSKSAREIPKALATFGEKQFKETGASAVEVLRVKTAVMRKHFRQLQGITYLVAVISLDRIRVYFFNASGVMLGAENFDASIYAKVRKTSKLVAKFEKPKVLTEEELRIEATQELRDNFGKAIRRVTRFLASKEPPFPDIFVTRNKNESLTQSFGLWISEDFEFIFEENRLSQNWTEGLLLRSAFLLHLDKKHWSNENACAIGNGLALILLKEPAQSHWNQIWKKESKGTIWDKVTVHFQEHQETYDSEVFRWLISVFKKSSESIPPDTWIPALSTIHDSVVVPLGTSEYHTIDGFCKTLDNPNQLIKRRHLLESIHLSPRVFCDGSLLNNELAVSFGKEEVANAWANVTCMEGPDKRVLSIGTNKMNMIHSIEYWLSLEDIYPSTTGPLSHGLDIIRRTLEKLGVVTSPTKTFETKLEMKKDRSLDSKEIAVLERLLLGDLEIISNTLVGSPHIVKSLLEKECIVFVPDFNHCGIEPNFIIHGLYDDVKRLGHSTLEATTLKYGTNAFGIVSAPTSWQRPLLETVSTSNLEIWPIISVQSDRRLLRYENLFVEGKKMLRWSDGTS